MSLINWNPARELMVLREAMNRLFDEGLSRSAEVGDRMAQLPIDVYSTENEFVVTAAVPGLKPEDVHITVEGDALTISGEIPPRLENVDHIFCERFHGKFIRTLKLNVPINADKIEATFENGLLTLVLPKAEAIKPKRIEVRAKK